MYYINTIHQPILLLSAYWEFHNFLVSLVLNILLNLFIYFYQLVFFFSELLVQALFKPGMKLNPEYKPKYIYLYAYSASVYEVTSGKKRKVINKDDLKSTIQAVDKVHSICNLNKSSTELIAEVATIYHCIRYLFQNKLLHYGKYNKL